MKKIGSFLIYLLPLLNCHIINVAQKDEVRGIVFERMEPELYWDDVKNQVILVDFTPYFARIYYYKSFILLQSSYEYRKLNFEGLNEDEQRKLADSTPFQIRYSSFVYSNNTNKGWRCDSNNVRSGRIVNKDSLLSREWITLQQDYDILKENNHRLISTTNSKDGNIIEEYSFKNKKDTTMTGRVILTFSKHFVETEFSLAKETEKLKKMKIIKMTVINDARYIPPSNAYIGRMEVPYELKELKITNQEELIKMFEAAEAALQKIRQ